VSQWTYGSCCLYVFYEYCCHNIFVINVYMVLFLFNNVISSLSCSGKIRFDSCSLYPHWSLHLFLGRPMCLRPFGLYCSACLDILLVSILCMCCSHFSWYCFISFTNNVIFIFLLLWLCFLIVCLCMTTLTEVFLCFLLSCKANARVKPAKTEHGLHSS
jgi:hypothetical protein